MNQRVRIAVIVMGFSGLIAEIFLLRELLIVFSGNELSIGIILANWLLLEAVGCFWPGRMIDQTEKKIELFVLTTILFSIALIAAVFATRLIKLSLGVSIGEHIGLMPMFYSSLLVLLPVSILHGALFTFSCRIYAQYGKPEADAAVAGRVYVDETVGTVAGGVICTFVFIPLLNSFEVVIGVAFINMIICLWLLGPASRRMTVPNHQHEGSTVEAETRRKDSGSLTTRLLTGILAAVTGIGLLTGQADRIHQKSIELQWRDHNVVHYQNSPYSNITVLENQGQYLFFLDGIPEIITPVPDMLFVEEFVHLPMLA
ncbi:MAG: spermine synthase, partial [Balneolaceae bacterium]